MCRATLLLAILGPLLLGLAPLEAGDLIALKDGTVYLGEVTKLTEKAVTIEAVFPVAGTRTIPIEALRDSTVWQLRSRAIAPGDGEARLELGRWAEERDLLGAALSEYGRAVRIEATAARAASRIAVVEGKLAMGLVERGQRYLLAERPGAARRYFETVLERYPKQPAAALARRGLAEVNREIAAVKAARKTRLLTRKRAAWEAQVSRIARHLDRAARYEEVAAHGARSVHTTAKLKKALRHLTAAWTLVQNLGNPPGRPAPDPQELRRQVKARLVKTYLDIGLAYLLRLSINQAEEYCAKACDLDPENASSHSLHQRIIDARLATSGVRGRWR